MDPGLRAVLDGLEAYASPAHLGRPLGEGPELEGAIATIKSSLSGIEQVRTFGRMAIVELLTQVPGDDPQQVLLSVMGIPDFDAAPMDPTRELAGASLELIRQFREPESLWALWEEREDVALEIFAWHCIARQRLTTAGIMPPVGTEGA